MKNIFFTVIFLIFANLCNSQSDTIYLYTPNGTPVKADLTTEASQSMIDYWTNYAVNEFPNAEMLAPASALYNCHSYAWNMVEGGPECWLGHPYEVWKYWEDGSYVETTEEYAKKIVWFQDYGDDFLPPDLYEPDLYEDHSCVKSATHPGMYESKWGPYPLFRHLPNDHMFAAPDTSYVTVIKYYRKACNTNAPDTVITTHAVFGDSIMYSGNVTISSGATLTVYNTIKFEENAGIVIQPGGKLVVNGGTLTNACSDKLWKGITVAGSTTTPQNEQTQGSVILTNATIENALVAVNAALLKGGSNGGIIRATNTNFVNNVQAIDYGSYENKDASGAIIDNVGTFTRCTFTVNSSNLFAANGRSFIQHVKLNKVRGIKFYGCAFSNETGIGGTGIDAMNAGFTVREYCAINMANKCACPENFNSPSVFENLTCGIRVENIENPCYINIDQSEFENNTSSVSIHASCNYSITRNLFSNIQLYGVSSTASSGYRIEENTFTGASSTAAAGIRMNHSGTAENIIYRNSFKNLDKGIAVTRLNGSILSSAQGINTGLQFLCNVFSNNNKDIDADASVIIRIHQGRLSAGADNQFNSTLTSSLFIDSTQPVFYFHSLGNNNLKPHYPTPNVITNHTATPGRCEST